MLETLFFLLQAAVGEAHRDARKNQAEKLSSAVLWKFFTVHRVTVLQCKFKKHFCIFIWTIMISYCGLCNISDNLNLLSVSPKRNGRMFQFHAQVRLNNIRM